MYYMLFCGGLDGMRLLELLNITMSTGSNFLTSFLERVQVEWGKHYGGSNAYTFRKEGVGEVPARSEEDDDGDE